MGSNSELTVDSEMSWKNSKRLPKLIRAGNLKQVQKYIQLNPNSEIGDEPPVHIAVAYGHQDILAYFLDVVGVPLSTLNRSFDSLMHTAIRKEQPQMIRELHRRGLVFPTASYWNITSLHLAVALDNYSIVGIIIELGHHDGIDLLSIENKLGCIPLFEARSPAMLETLIKAEADITKKSTANGKTIFHHIMGRCCPVVECLDILVRAGNRKSPGLGSKLLEAPDWRGSAPFLCCKSSQEEIIGVIRLGCNPHYAHPRDGNLLDRMMIAPPCTEIFNMLVALGLEPQLENNRQLLDISIHHLDPKFVLATRYNAYFGHSLVFRLLLALGV